MSNKSIFFSGNSRQSQVIWNQTSGVKALMLRGGLLYSENASGASGWASVEAPDVFAAAGSVGYVGSWTSTEAPDVFAGLGGVPDTGTWTDVENPDTFSAYVFQPPVGTWASTEAPDLMGSATFERFEVESVVTAGSPFSFSTNGPNRVICVFVATSASGSAADHVTSVSDTTGLVWYPQDYLDIGLTEAGNPLHTEMWWAYAKDKITSATLTINYGGGFSFTKKVAAMATIKGMYGNAANPFSDSNPYSYGGNYGAFVTPPNTQIGLSRPVATGPLSSSGAVTNPITFDPATVHGVTVDGTHLKATSVGSGGPNNYVTIQASDAKLTGRVYFEVKFVNIAGSKYGFGIAWFSDSAQEITSCIGNGTGGFIVRGDGSIWANGSQVATLGVTPANNDIIGIAIDFDHATLWARDVTQSGSYNNNPSALPEYSTSHFGAGGAGYVAGVSPPDSVGAAHLGTGSILVPFACTDGTSASAEIDANFGATSFAGSPPPGYQAGWGTVAPAVTPTRVTQHAIVLGWDMSVPDDAIAQAPSGFTLRYAHIGDISAGLRLSIYDKVISQNILTTDSEFMTQGTVTKHWLMSYDTIVAEFVSPGTLESTEAADSFHAVGYGPGGAGQFGFLTATETKDTFAAVGAVAISGSMTLIEAKDTFSAFISVPIRGVFVTAEAPDRFAGTGIGLGEDGMWMSTEVLDTLTINGVVPIAGTFDTSETADRFRAIGAGVVTSRRRRRRTFVT